MLSIKEINKKIGGVKRSTTAIHNAVQLVICNVAGHVVDYGDTTGYDRLRAVLGAYHQRAVDTWIKSNGCARFDSKKGAYVIDRKAKAAIVADGACGADFTAQLTDTAVKWWNKPSSSQDAKAFDVAKKIKAIVSGMDKDGAMIVLDVEECLDAILALKATIKQYDQLDMDAAA